MATADTSKRLRYLDESAHLLNNASPAISAHLMSQFYKVGFDHEMDISDARRRAACGACGSLHIPGWTSSISTAGKDPSKAKGSHASKKVTSSPDKEQKSHREKKIIYACSTCGRETHQGLPRRLRIEPKQPQVRTVESAASALQQVSRQRSLRPPEGAGAVVSKSKTINDSSRRRAKARKQGGLRALLSQKQAQSSSGNNKSKDYGLDLMDILKP
ncbi:MAG: hypothetical protein M1816_004637 [Peltula sp. TS41687]|nr:MAG: hypothetical protein M1816_004637 [Peltula sp. TS41687]